MLLDFGPKNATQKTSGDMARAADLMRYNTLLGVGGRRWFVVWWNGQGENKQKGIYQFRWFPPPPEILHR